MCLCAYVPVCLCACAPVRLCACAPVRLWQSRAMLLTLNIDQLAPGRYRAVLTDGSVPVTDSEPIFTSIADAIRQSSEAVPEGFAYFIEPRFAGVSCGTLRLADARQSEFAENAARSIISVVAQLHALGPQ